MDPLLKSVLSGSYQTPGNGALIRESMVALARYARALEAGLPPEAFASQEAAEVPPSPPPPSDNNLPDPPSVVPTNPHEAQSINDEISNLTDNLKRSLTLTGSADRFFGYSSSLSLLDKSPLSTDVSGDPISQQVGAIPVKVQLRPQFWAVHPVSKFAVSPGSASDAPMILVGEALACRRHTIRFPSSRFTHGVGPAIFCSPGNLCFSSSSTVI